MSVEVKAQNTISMTSVKAIKDATEQSAQLLATMEQYAEDAGTTLTGIYQDAEDAKTNADIAIQSAETALIQLSIVEDVVGTVNWIAQHGYYQLSTDETVVDTKTYYTVTATAIPNPTGNPSLSRYYERSGAGTEQEPYIYTLSTDTTVVAGETYYSLTATTVANPTGSPASNLYYELIINEAVAQYISTHLSLTEDGLLLFADNNAGSMLLSTSGATIKNANGDIVGEYGEGAIIGNKNRSHIAIIGGAINFWNGDENNPDNLVAYVTGQEMHIPRVVVVQSIQMGHWKWATDVEDQEFQYHLSLNWVG